MPLSDNAHGHVGAREAIRFISQHLRANQKKPVIFLDPHPATETKDFTAEARRTRSKEILIKIYSELCELRVSAVSLPKVCETHS